jgi:hypothetical protein
MNNISNTLGITIEKVTAATIRVTSIDAFGKDSLVMWVGYPHDINFSESDDEIDTSNASIKNAKQYQYKDLDVTYRFGKAYQVKVLGNCPSQGAFFWTGVCNVDVAEDLRVDDNYFKSVGG